MEQIPFAQELILGQERLLVSGAGQRELIKNSWDEKRHCNAEWELHLILRGSCHVNVVDRSYHLGASQMMLIAPGRHHRPQAAPGDFQRFSIAFSAREGKLLTQLSRCIQDSIVMDAPGELCRLALCVAQECAGNRPFWQSCSKALLTTLMIGLFRLFEIADESVEVTEMASAGELVQAIDSFFEQHFADTSGEKMLAAQIHVSRRHLVRILQTHYGMTFRQKLLHTRMDHAAWLLRTTQCNITQISSAVGYSSESAFFKVFRQYFNMTPKQYRHQKSP